MGIYDQAEMLAALWQLGGGGRMPIDGRLDRALHSVRDALPAQLAELTFGATSVGLRCYELPDIVFAEQEAMLLEVDGVGFTCANVRLSRNEARAIAISGGLSTLDAEHVGSALTKAVAE